MAVEQFVVMKEYVAQCGAVSLQTHFFHFPSFIQPDIMSMLRFH